MRILRMGLFLFLAWYAHSAIAMKDCLPLLTPNAKLTQDVIDSLSPLEGRFLRSKGQLLFYDPHSPVMGNLKGKVTLVEFFDYQCAYCKQFSPIMDKIAKTYPSLRVVFKELTMFGPESEKASLASLAAANQGTYFALHEKLMNAKSLNDDAIRKLSHSAGISEEAIQAYTPQAKQELKDNVGLVDDLDIVGTPSFVIARIQEDQLKNQNYSNVAAYFVSRPLIIAELQELVKQFVEKC